MQLYRKVYIRILQNGRLRQVMVREGRKAQHREVRYFAACTFVQFSRDKARRPYHLSGIYVSKDSVITDTMFARLGLWSWLGFMERGALGCRSGLDVSLMNSNSQHPSRLGGDYFGYVMHGLLT